MDAPPPPLFVKHPPSRDEQLVPPPSSAFPRFGDNATRFRIWWRVSCLRVWTSELTRAERYEKSCFSRSQYFQQFLPRAPFARQEYCTALHEVEMHKRCDTSLTPSRLWLQGPSASPPPFPIPLRSPSNSTTKVVRRDRALFPLSLLFHAIAPKRKLGYFKSACGFTRFSRSGIPGASSCRVVIRGTTGQEQARLPALVPFPVVCFSTS